MARTPQPPEPQRERWEYLVSEIPLGTTAVMDALIAFGAEGWELVSVDWHYRRCVLKRRIREP